MFNTIKNGLIGVAAVGALALGASQAQALNIGGIIIDAGANIKVGSVYENQVGGAGDPLSGYGEVSFVNGTADFCAGGFGSCELTFVFGGYTVKAISPTEVVFEGGWVNFYVDSTPDFQIPGAASDAAAIASASDGDLWLSLSGHETLYPASGFGPITGTLQGLGAILGGTIAGFGSGLLDVDDNNGSGEGAGLANVFFDTDTYADALGGTADLTLDTSFTSQNVPFANCAGQTGCLQGSATVNSNVVPEPGTLSILSLGLLGLGALRRRRQAA